MNNFTEKLIATLLLVVGSVFAGNSEEVRPFVDYSATADLVQANRKTVQEIKQLLPGVDAEHTLGVKVKKGEMKRSMRSKAAKSVAKVTSEAMTALTGKQIIGINYDENENFYSSAKISYRLDGDTLIIKGFNRMDSIKAKVDLDGNTITIPNQKMYNSATYGACNIMPFDKTTKVVDEKGPVMGTINGDVITLDPWLCIIMEGQYAGYALGTYYNKTVLTPSNTVMKNVELDDNNQNVNKEYPVYMEQTGNSLVKIYNFLGFSCCVEVQIRSGNNLFISPQLLYKSSDYGYFYTYAANWADGVFYPYNKILGKTEGSKMTWGNWTSQTSNGNYATNRVVSTEMDIPFTLKEPTAQTQAGFKGTGTEADPYLIENIADLIALSDSVNTAIPESGATYTKAFEGKYFKQTATINLNGYNFPPIGGEEGFYRFAGTYDGNNKTISNLNVSTSGDRGYCGLFGAADTVAVIKNVKLSNPVANAQGYCTGTLAGWNQGLTENCSVTGGKVVGKFCTGGVIGYAGPTTNVTFAGTVTGDGQTGGVAGVSHSPLNGLSATKATVTSVSNVTGSCIGGVVGSMTNKREGYIKNCYFSGQVVLAKTGQYAGTIVGGISDTRLEECFSIGEILTQGKGTVYVGGLSGVAQGSVVSDCYFAGNMMIPGYYSGALIGYIFNIPNHAGTVIKNCYMSGVCQLSSTDSYMPYVGKFDRSTGGDDPQIVNCKFDKQVMPMMASHDGAMTTAEMTKATGIEGFSSDVWTFTEKFYPRLKNIASSASVNVSVAPIYLTSDNESVEFIDSNFTVPTANSVTWKVLNNGTYGTTGHGITIEKDQVYLNGAFSADTIQASSSSCTKYYFIRTSPKSLFEGEGTEENPFLLKTKEDLIKLSEGTTNNRLTFDNTYFKITNDIDLEYDEAFLGISATTSSSYSFGGVIDGGDHYIHRCRIHGGEVDDAGTITLKLTCKGFVGRLKAGGVVKNLRIAKDCDFKFYATSGAVVGSCYGTIENCRNYADVVAYSGTVGGIAGENRAGARIEKCYNAGKITSGYFNAGGIAAFNYGAIENCQNDGEISNQILSTQYSATSLNSAAGICVSPLAGATVKNVLNTGYIHSNKYVGGITAVYNGTKDAVMASSTLNIGILQSNDQTTIGNLTGRLYKTLTAENNYYDGELSPYGACANAEQANVIVAKTSELTSGEPLEGLSTEYWQYETGKYPVLKAFADEPGSKAAAMSVVKFTGSERSDKVKTDADLAQNEGLTWTVVNGKSFKVDGTKLSLAPVADELADTLVATCQGFVKRIPIVATPDVVPTPTISLAYSDGNYVLTMACEMADASIYYTVDGTEPTTSATKYEKELLLDAKSQYVVKAIGAKHNYLNSEVATMDTAASGIDENSASEKDVLSVVYVSASGVKSAEPFEGVNIVMTTYVDGSVKVSKKVVK